MPKALWYSKCPIPTCKRHTAKALKNEDWEGLMEAIQRHVRNSHPHLADSFWADHGKWIKANVERWEPAADVESGWRIVALVRSPSPKQSDRSRLRSRSPKRAADLPLTPAMAMAPRHIPRTPWPATMTDDEALSLFWLESEQAKWRFLKRTGRLSGYAPYPC